MLKGMKFYEEDPLAGEGAGAAAEGGAGGDPLGGEGGAGGDPLGGEGEGAGAEGGAEGTGGEGGAEGAGGAKAAPAPDTNVALAAAVAKLADRLDSKPGQAPLTPEQQEAAWQDLEARSGMTRQQLQWQDQQFRRQAVLANLPTNKELGKMKAEKIIDDPELLAKVEKSMAALPPEIQANPQAWEDAAYLELGRASRTVKKEKINQGGEGTQTNGAQRRIIGGAGTGAAAAQRGAGAQRQAAKKEYPAFEQHVINRQFGGDAEAYEKYKTNKSIENDVRIKAEPGASVADKELERLTADNT